MLKKVFLLCIWRTVVKQNAVADTFTKNTFRSQVGKRFSVCDFSYRGIVTSEGTHWDLKLGAVHLTFPPGAVSEPTSIVVHRWKCSACSPQLQEHEAVVSRVIEISTNNYELLEFNAEVKLVLSHSAPGLQGYELVLKRLINKESNEWEDVGETEDLRHLEGKKNFF